MRRWVLAAALFLYAGLAVPAGAEVIYEESAQQEGIGLQEAPEGVTDAVFREAWELFTGTDEGKRIVAELRRRDDVEVRVEIVDEISDEGVDAYGQAILFKHPNDDGQTRIKIEISRDRKGTAAGVAETLYHEFRHAEMYAEGDLNDGHEELHADEDTLMHAFRQQLDAVLLVDHTPIYDEIEAKAEEERRLRAESIRLANALGDLVHTDLESPPTYTGGEVDIVDFVSVESFKSTSLGAAADGATAVDSDGSCVSDQDSGVVICGGSDAALDDLDQDFHFVGMKLGAMVPLEGFDQEIEYVLAVDSDGDPGNNHAGRSRFAEDPAAGTDRWLTLKFTPNTDGWRFTVWQVGDGGTGVNIDREAQEFGVIEDDTVIFGLPPNEYADPPQFKLYALTHDGSYGGRVGMDTSGTLPSDPPVGFDGTRFGGYSTAAASNSRGDLILYFGPPKIVQGTDFVADFCVVSNSGAAGPGSEVASTLGDPPSGPTATHAQGVLNDGGCVRMRLPVLEPPGQSFLFFFDGEEVVELLPMIVATPKPSYDD